MNEFFGSLINFIPSPIFSTNKGRLKNIIALTTILFSCLSLREKQHLERGKGIANIYVNIGRKRK